MFGSNVRAKLAVAVSVPIVAAVAIGATPQLAVAAKPKPIPVPVVLSFAANKTSFTNAGGSVVLRAKMKYAASCKMTVSPPLTGFPRSFSCSSGSTKQTASLKLNKGQNPITYTFGLKVKNSSGTGAATNVTVTEGAAPPPISFSTPTPGNSTTLVFGPEGVFVADDPLVVTVTNHSSTTQLITAVTIGTTTGDPNDFILNRNNCGYITAHATCSLAVQFQPTGAGTRTGVVYVQDASWGKSGNAAVLNLRGTGVWASATVSNSNVSQNVLNFGNQVVLTASSAQLVKVLNVGTVPLYISGISSTGGNSADFVPTPGSCIDQITANYPLIVSVGASCTFDVVFDPSGDGLRTSNLVVDDNTLPTQTQLAVEGTGTGG